jgi:hypothetical protein
MQDLGVRVLDTLEKKLACGDVGFFMLYLGLGAMMEPIQIYESFVDFIT